jgi:HD-GYP domain-containing protein (c-di-GMP phosphodiesterase class II)
MVERRDVEAALEARRELGKEYEPDIVEALVDKIERRLDGARNRSHRSREQQTPMGSAAS